MKIHKLKLNKTRSYINNMLSNKMKLVNLQSKILILQIYLWIVKFKVKDFSLFKRIMSNNQIYSLIIISIIINDFKIY